MARAKGFIRFDVPPPSWALALERTRGLAEERLRWDGDIHALLANAYLQGVTDVGANLELVKRIIETAEAPAPDQHYHGA